MFFPSMYPSSAIFFLKPSIAGPNCASASRAPTRKTLCAPASRGFIQMTKNTKNETSRDPISIPLPQLTGLFRRRRDLSARNHFEDGLFAEAPAAAEFSRGNGSLAGQIINGPGVYFQQRSDFSCG